MEASFFIGSASFLLPFLACPAAAYYVLLWEVMPSWLAGVAMSTTSVAVAYAVMLEFGFNVTSYGKTVLAACFVTDLGTVVALGLIFAAYTMRTMIFPGVGVVVFASFGFMAIGPRFGPRSWKRNFCCFASWEWALWPLGRIAKPCFRLT
jgi:glutathione-regulated potassium-efflux system ancillary protein KefC